MILCLRVVSCGFGVEENVRRLKRYNWVETRLTDLFRSRSREQWCALLEGSDACFAPVLSLAESVQHPHNAARGIYQITSSGAIEAAPAPRFQALNATTTQETKK